MSNLDIDEYGNVRRKKSGGDNGAGAGAGHDNPEILTQEPVNLATATPALLERAVRAAQLSDDPKVIIPVLDALLKRGMASQSEIKHHDIREIMRVLTQEQLDFLEATARGGMSR